MAAQSEALAARQPSGADAADRTSEEDLALSWRMLQTLLASSQQMGDRLANWVRSGGLVGPRRHGAETGLVALNP